MKNALFLLIIFLAWTGTFSSVLSLDSSIGYADSKYDATLLNEQEPGFVIQGWVLNGCDGVPNVQIFQSFAAYAGEIIATTDTNGYYKSEYIYVPGDEMVGVWAVLDGFTFEPEYYFWRHNMGYREYTLNFAAVGKPPTSDCFYLPMITKAEP